MEVICIKNVVMENGIVAFRRGKKYLAELLIEVSESKLVAINEQQGRHTIDNVNLQYINFFKEHFITKEEHERQLKDPTIAPMREIGYEI